MSDLVQRLRAGGFHLTAEPIHIEAADTIDALTKLLAEIAAQSKMANDAIRAKRYDTGGGRVKISTCLHHIERLSGEALAKAGIQ